MHLPNLSNRHIGHRIQLARIDATLSLAAMAELTGISENQLQAFEQDDDMITAVELLTIASACRLPVEYFVRADLPVDGFEKWSVWDSYQRLEPIERQRVRKLIDDLICDQPIT